MDYKAEVLNGKMIFKLYYKGRYNFTMLFLLSEFRMLINHFKDAVKKFNGLYTFNHKVFFTTTNDEHRGLFFETLEDATKAFTYVQGIIVANKLTGK